MASQPADARKTSEQVPLAQRLFDNWVLLMIAGILIMAVIYTGWGLYEVVTMPRAQLP
jgi:hypothetical protein